MSRNEYEQTKTLMYYTNVLNSNVLYYQYMDLFSHVFHLFFSHLITEILILECLY